MSRDVLAQSGQPSWTNAASRRHIRAANGVSLLVVGRCGLLLETGTMMTVIGLAYSFVLRIHSLLGHETDGR